MIEEGDHLVVASNRGPVSWRKDASGGLIPRRGSGGLVTAVGAALQEEPGTWVSVALSAEDREIAARHLHKPFTVETDGASFRLRLLDVGMRYEPYYNNVANRMLWFTLHGVWAEPFQPRGLNWRAPWQDAYINVNHRVADAVAEAAEDGAEVYLQDYHLTVAPQRVRERLPHAPILHYLHTPWPEPSYLRHLPDPISSQILTSLLAADVVAFSSPTWAQAFRSCAAAQLGATIDGDTVRYAGRRTVVQDFVLGVDEGDLHQTLGAPATQAAVQKLDEEARGRQMIVRVDRTDLSKNILRGLLAYELLLQTHPEHHGRVWHYAHLNPSRQSVVEYRDYLDACLTAADRIRERFGPDSLRVFLGDDYPTAVAALSRCDVLLTNPVMDGTNLVAKEGAVLTQRDAVLVLSREAGAADVMGQGALLINPYDVEEQAAALHRALTMPADERSTRAEHNRQGARIGAPSEWFNAQREVLRTTVARR